MKAAEIGLFVKQYARKAQKGAEPNDRRYDKATRKGMKHLTPEALDRLIRHGEDD